jgi:hypothetical protein
MVLMFSIIQYKKTHNTMNDIWQRGATVGAAGGGAAGGGAAGGGGRPSTGAAGGGGRPSDGYIRRRGNKFQAERRNQKRRGCIVCKEARELCKTHRRCYDDDNYYSHCNEYGNNEDIHDLLKYNSDAECICNCDGLEKLLEKKETIEENRKLVYSLYLIREQKSPGERYSIYQDRKRYGFLKYDFIWMIFRKFMNPIPDIPTDYISDWPRRWSSNKEEKEEEEMAQKGFIHCPCGCSYWIHWKEDTYDFRHRHY